ncbi:MAG: SLBB domain-containing protein, partial [Candidatus Rokubacteria bacterium]|nr:SLBB domain-containing protein [Candidatus Rokubacteria bacterium]
VVEIRGAFLGTGADPGRTTTMGKATLVARVELAGGDRIKDVVVKAGGVAPYADFRRAFVERGGVSGPRQTIPVDLQRLLVEKDEGQNLALQNGDLFVVPVVEDKVYVIGNVRAPGSFDYRPFYSSKDYILLAGGPDRRAKMRAATVMFPDGKIYKLDQAPRLEPGAVVQVPEVLLKWYEDYLLIASAVASIVTAYTGLYILFGGPIFVPADGHR